MNDIMITITGAKRNVNCASDRADQDEQEGSPPSGLRDQEPGTGRTELVLAGPGDVGICQPDPLQIGHPLHVLARLQGRQARQAAISCLDAVRAHSARSPTATSGRGRRSSSFGNLTLHIAYTATGRASYAFVRLALLRLLPV